jgi:hypothetical protein
MVAPPPEAITGFVPEKAPAAEGRRRYAQPFCAPRRMVNGSGLQPPAPARRLFMSERGARRWCAPFCIFSFGSSARIPFSVHIACTWYEAQFTSVRFQSAASTISSSCLNTGRFTSRIGEGESGPIGYPAAPARGDPEYRPGAEERSLRRFLCDREASGRWQQKTKSSTAPLASCQQTEKVLSSR